LGREASRANDGDTTNSVWDGDSISETCKEDHAWWMVDLGSDKQHSISTVSVYNRWDNERLKKTIYLANVEILDEYLNVVESKPVRAIKEEYIFDFGSVQGRFVRLKKTSPGSLNIAEVEVMGSSSSTGVQPTPPPTPLTNPNAPTTSLPTALPTPQPSPPPTPLSTDQPGTSVNLAVQPGAVASQSSTCLGREASRANDGDTTNSVWDGDSISETCKEDHAWWMVDLGSDKQHSISTVSVYNRWDNERLKKTIYLANVEILDEYLNVVESKPVRAIKEEYIFDFGSVQGRFVRLKKTSPGSLNIAEVEVMGSSSP